MEKIDEFMRCACILISFLTLCTAIDTLVANQTIKDGETIASAGENFELGFFSLKDSNTRYLGIWSKKIDTRTVVWVPNKETPFRNTSGELKLDADGRLQLRDGNTVIWSTDFPYRTSVNPVAQLLDTGNFVVRDLFSPDINNIIWQSNPSYNGCVSCGLNSVCNNTSIACSCLTGLEPRQPERWNLGDWSSGCVRDRSVVCVADGYQKFSGFKLPDSQLSWYNLSMSREECVLACDTDCSCSAYASPDNGSGCSLWFGDLKNTIRVNPGGQELHVKLTKLKGSIIAGAKSESNRNKVLKVVVSVAVSLTVVGLILALYAWSKKRRSFMLKKGKVVQALNEDYTNESQKEAADVPSFSLSKIVMSTNNFSINNKLGQGGFGPVYKGVLDGREIAVKRLSKTSSQGFDEFKNEVRCIAQLQHRNLVKLLGYCIQGDEIMLIYEYMPNKSLDSFIFDELKSLMLDWPRRFHIIHGIARGLLYLHQDSRLRVIHRDLKAGNILLDLDLNPKISDFGLARRFRGHESEANTNKVVGTLGYISPEYAANGLFSVKSDVFSFGVLLLEIVSGKKNRGFSHLEHNDNLLGHAWRLYRAGKSLELVSAPLYDSLVEFEVIRAIHIGLLCVQDLAEDRPTMSLVVSMLDNDGVLPPPNQPAFFSEKSPVVMSSITSTVSSVSVNNVTITVLDAR